jgi:hypothetical protein
MLRANIMAFCGLTFSLKLLEIHTSFVVCHCNVSDNNVCSGIGFEICQQMQRLLLLNNIRIPSLQGLDA